MLLSLKSEKTPEYVTFITMEQIDIMKMDVQMCLITSLWEVMQPPFRYTLVCGCIKIMLIVQVLFKTPAVPKFHCVLYALGCRINRFSFYFRVLHVNFNQQFLPQMSAFNIEKIILSHMGFCAKKHGRQCFFNLGIQSEQNKQDVLLNRNQIFKELLRLSMGKYPAGTVDTALYLPLFSGVWTSGTFFQTR